MASLFSWRYQSRDPHSTDWNRVLTVSQQLHDEGMNIMMTTTEGFKYLGQDLKGPWD